jgi:hypothetical protein
VRSDPLSALLEISLDPGSGRGKEGEEGLQPHATSWRATAGTSTFPVRRRENAIALRLSDGRLSGLSAQFGLRNAAACCSAASD